jgi:hypothetical protein
MTRHLTLQLDEVLLQEAEQTAANQDRRLEEWVADLIAERLGRDSAFEAARARALGRLDRGLDLGGTPLTREQAHGR